MSSTGADLEVRSGTGSGRLDGPDVTRAIAMAGVVIMNYHGYLILRGGERGGSWLADLFDPWTGPLSTRFAATFVLVAGVGVVLLSRSALRDPARLPTLRWRLVSRGVVLYVFGLAFDFIWRGSILPFYGAMFVLAAVLVTLRIRWLVLIGFGAAIGGWGLRWWRLERELEGHSTTWLTDPGPRSIRGLLFDVVVNGTHPLLPWLAFLCAGMVIGRCLLDDRARSWWRPVTIGGGFILFASATLAELAFTEAELGGAARATVLWSTDPFERGLLYTASALGTAMIGFAVIDALITRAGRTVIVESLARIGRMSLTVYVAHALIFNLLVDWWGWITPAGVGTALISALVIWVVISAAALAWQRQFGRGPFEAAYRAITV